jgi:hypothetical protein
MIRGVETALKAIFNESFTINVMILAAVYASKHSGP